MVSRFSFNMDFLLWLTSGVETNIRSKRRRMTVCQAAALLGQRSQQSALAILLNMLNNFDHKKYYYQHC
jgi:hypothetical protein